MRYWSLSEFLKRRSAAAERYIERFVQAGLDDVFVHFSGAVIEHGGDFRDIRESRDTIKRLG